VLAPVEERDMKSALALAQQLRAAGLRIDLLPKATQPGKLRKHADDQGIAAVVWLEPDAKDASVWRKADGSTLKNLAPAALTDALRSGTDKG
jgi:histidyl-tRNA synthetase